jgi:uncharacterized membrane protein YedE/YeeE
MEILRHPWHWSIAGVLIGLTVPMLYLLGNKPFGISSTFRHICAASLPSKIPFFNYDWKKERWNLFFVAGIAIGGFIGATLLANPEPIKIVPSTHADLVRLGVTQFTQLEPTDVFSFRSLLTVRGFIIMVLGGFMVGFGTRYAGGCTSGHSITGIANLQVSSLIATAFFMIGGFFVTWLIMPLIFKL